MFDLRKWAILAAMLGLMGLVACAKNKDKKETPNIAVGPPKVNCNDTNLYYYDTSKRQWLRRDNKKVVNCNPNSGVLPLDNQSGCSIYNEYYRVNFGNTASNNNLYCVHTSYFPAEYRTYLNPYTIYQGGSCTARVNCSYYNNHGYYHNHGYYDNNYWHPTPGGFYIGIGVGLGWHF